MVDIYSYTFTTKSVHPLSEGIILNTINVVTLSMSTEQVTYKILLGMAVADLMVNITLFCSSTIFLARPYNVKFYGIGPLVAISVTIRLFASGVHQLIDIATGYYSRHVRHDSFADTFILNKVGLILQSCNHTGNFFIYIIANSTLRKNFLQRFIKVKEAVCVNAATSSDFVKLNSFTFYIYIYRMTLFTTITCFRVAL
ncbi:hypothetical protein EB796_014868 [Bugula neritina]|uniref:Uncharacterized protein n=1 Tax=Bugula neritina TaxID=10212 RepID=A0A7J7JLS3_BUGNE|nr:hypothetical protein EB796_014868 [Bugula neritina]